MKNKALVMVAIVTVAAALVASTTTAPYNYAFAGKRNSGDSNAQSSASNNDCPAVVDSLLAIQQQAFAGCIINGNQVQDSDGTATSQIPFNTGPNQAIEVKLGEGEQGPPGPPGPPGPAGEGCEDTVRVHTSGGARWWGTTDAGDHFVVEGYPNPGFNTDWPDTPGSANVYDQYPPNNPEEFNTGLDVCVPELPNSTPTPYAP